MGSPHMAQCCNLRSLLFVPGPPPRAPHFTAARPPSHHRYYAQKAALMAAGAAGAISINDDFAGKIIE